MNLCQTHPIIKAVTAHRVLVASCEKKCSNLKLIKHIFQSTLNNESLTNLPLFSIDQQYAEISVLIKLQKLRLLTGILMLIFMRTKMAA